MSEREQAHTYTVNNKFVCDSERESEGPTATEKMVESDTKSNALLIYFFLCLPKTSMINITFT